MSLFLSNYKKIRKSIFGYNINLNFIILINSTKINKNWACMHAIIKLRYIIKEKKSKADMKRVYKESEAGSIGERGGDGYGRKM